MAAGGLLAGAWLDCLPAAAEPSSDERCILEAGPSRAVVRVIDAETLALDDGSEVRLIGALPPRLPGTGDFAPEAERGSRAALERLVQGRGVALKFGGRRSDRYGRWLAQVYVDVDGRQIWAQGALLADGLARAYALPGNAACLSELLEQERQARVQGRGLWGSTAYRVREATDVRDLLRRAGSFEVVEGVVRDVSMVGGRAYMNFGADWRRDFTVSVGPALLRGAPEGEARLKAMIGKRVRVRGWIERRNGPLIELSALGEIERADGGEATNDQRPVVPQPGADTP